MTSELPTSRPGAPKPGAPQPGAPRPVFARHAASLIVWRSGPAGPEVLMGRRGAGHRFMPHRLVFPGGGVDRQDASSPAAAEPRADVLQTLRRAARPRLARALVAAAARELAEETGLTLGIPPRLDAVDYLCRAVTPPEFPMRFNARFFVADEDAVQGTPGDSGELEAVRFYPAGHALSLDLVLVTREVLERLLAWIALPSALRGARPHTEVFTRQRWRQE